MRKIIVLEHISLDGVIQAPGGPEEDTSGGFAYGRWAAPYDDDILGAALSKQMNMPFDLLLGRKTFDIWAAFWPQHADAWPVGVNTVANTSPSNTKTSHEWQPLSERRYRRNSRQAQARARARSTHLGKW